MTTEIWFNIASNNGLVPEMHQCITWINVDASVIFCGIKLRAISQEVLMNHESNMQHMFCGYAGKITTVSPRGSYLKMKEAYTSHILVFLMPW